MSEVRGKMRADRFLRKFVVKPDFVKRIADFVRYNTNKTRQMQLTQLGDLQEDDCVVSDSLQSGYRKTWAAHDIAVTERKFQSNQNLKGKKEILEIFSSDEVLSRILDREGTQRCYEKWKNLLRHKDH